MFPLPDNTFTFSQQPLMPIAGSNSNGEFIHHWSGWWETISEEISLIYFLIPFKSKSISHQPVCILVTKAKPITTILFQVTSSNNYGHTHPWDWSTLSKHPTKHKVWRPFLQVTVHRWFRTISEHAYPCSIVVLIALSPEALFGLK